MDSLPSWARPGVKVVCVIPFTANVGTKAIKKGAQLTISSVESYGQYTGLRFLELKNDLSKTDAGTMERLYVSYAFRPLISKSIEDDLAIFAPLLKTKKEEELV
jgi:hypothetical protein